MSVGLGMGRGTNRVRVTIECRVRDGRSIRLSSHSQVSYFGCRVGLVLPGLVPTNIIIISP